jgi:ribonuclease P protein component
MLKKENRLSTNFEFNVTRKHGEKISHSLFDLYYLQPYNYRGPVKIGFVVSARLAKNAVTRNRVKRVFREAVQKSIAELPENYWVVIHPKSLSLKEDYEKISAELDQALSKISLA